MSGLKKIRERLHDLAPFHWNGLNERARHEQQGHHGQLGKTAISVGSDLATVEHDDALLGKCRL